MEYEYPRLILGICRSRAVMLSAMADYAKTGVSGLDEILENKGIPRNYFVYILGSPGSGKTTLALQYLYTGATKYNEPGIYVSLDEEPNLLKTNMSRFGWNFDKLESQGRVVFIDASPVRVPSGEVKLLLAGRRSVVPGALVDQMESAIEQIGAKRIVVDPMIIFSVHYGQEIDRRAAIMDLMQGVARSNCTVLLISELAESSMDRKYGLEEYLAQGVIILRKLPRQRSLTRVIEIEKMRGVNHDTQLHPYQITQEGIVVYPSEIA